MDNNNNRRPSPLLPNVESSMDKGDWRTRFPPDARHKVIDSMMGPFTKRRHAFEPERLNEIRGALASFEEKNFNVAVSQADYYKLIWSKIGDSDAKLRNAAGSSTSIPVTNAVPSMDSRPTNQGHLLPGSLSTTHPQVQSNLASGMAGSTALPLSMPPVTSVFNQNSSMQNIGGMLQDSSKQHGLSSNMVFGSERMQARPRGMSSQQPHNALYQQKLEQQQLHKQSSPQLSAQQMTQSLLRHNQSSLLSSQPQSQHAPGIHQLQNSLPQQSISPLKQQQTQIVLQQNSNSSGIQQTQMMGQHVVGDMQQQHQQRLPNQQKQTQQHLMSKQNSIQATHQQPLGTQTLGQVTSSLVPPHNVIDQNRGDWQEEAFQKIKSMKEKHLSGLTELYQIAKLQQDSLAQQQPSDQIEKLKQLKKLLERMMQFLSLSKSNIMPGLKDKLDYYEKQIIGVLNKYRPRKTVQQGQLPQSQLQTMQQPQSQTAQDQSHDCQSNPQMQSRSLQSFGPRAQQSNLTNMQNNVLSSRPGVSAPQQIIARPRPASGIESGQGNALNNGQQVSMGSMQENTVQSELSDGSRLLQMHEQLLQQHYDQQLQRQLQARKQTAQLPQMNDLRARQGRNVSRDMFPLQGQRSTCPLQKIKKGTQLPASSPQLLQSASPRMEQKNLYSVIKMETPLQPANALCAVQSPSTPMAPSLMEVDSEKPSGTSPLSSISGKPSATELPIERLIRAVKSISSEALSSAASDIYSVLSMVDRIAGSEPGNGSEASVGEDLVAMTKFRLQERSFMTQEGMTATKKRKRETWEIQSSVVSLGGNAGDNYKQFACAETSDSESSTATSGGKKARTETKLGLLKEIKEINQRLIDTVVEISDDPSEGREGTKVKFSFIAASVSPALKAHLWSTQMSPIQPLSLLVPCSYLNGSPCLLDSLQVETRYKHPPSSKKEKEDLSSKATARFKVLLRSLSQPVSLKDIAKTWDRCARDVICEYAQQFGGGTFSSKYGTWEKCVAAAAS